MSSKVSTRNAGFDINLVAVFFGAATLYISVQLTQFGIIHAPIDLLELSNAEQSRVERKAFAQKCTKWVSEFGYRLICRKALADHYFTYEFRNVGDSKPRQIAEDVLRISPLEPAYYALRAHLGLYAFEPSANIIQLLRLSYLSGRAEQSVMFDRFRIALAVWDKLEDSEKSIAMNDFIKNYSARREDLYQLILAGSPLILRDILPMLKLRDPEVYSRFVEDMAANK
jgi:hypothetical protein